MIKRKFDIKLFIKKLAIHFPIVLLVPFFIDPTRNIKGIINYFSPNDLGDVLFWIICGIGAATIPALIEYNSKIKNTSNTKRAISIIVFYLIYCLYLYAHLTFY